MKFNKDNKYIQWGLTAFAVLAGAIAFYYFIDRKSTRLNSSHDN